MQPAYFEAINVSSTALSAVSFAAIGIRYEVLRADRLDQARFDAERSLATSGLALVLSILLFGIPWRWLRADVSIERDNIPPIRDN